MAIIAAATTAAAAARLAPRLGACAQRRCHRAPWRAVKAPHRQQRVLELARLRVAAWVDWQAAKAQRLPLRVLVSVHRLAVAMPLRLVGRVLPLQHHVPASARRPVVATPREQRHQQEPEAQPVHKDKLAATSPVRAVCAPLPVLPPAHRPQACAALQVRRDRRAPTLQAMASAA